MPSAGQEAASWHELRTMLTGPEQRQLAQILKRLDDPVRRAEELAHLVTRDAMIGTGLPRTP